MRMPHLLLMVAALAVGGCAGGRAQRPQERVTPVDHDFGTLAYKGQVTRIDRGVAFEYRLELELRFLPDAPVNRTDAIDLEACRLSVTRGVKGPPVAVHFLESREVRVHLDRAHPGGRLPTLSFAVKKRALEGADHVLFDCENRMLAWPMGTELL